MAEMYPQQAKPRVDQMENLAVWLYVLAALVGLAEVVVGLVLALHKVPVCDAGICSGSRHPFTLAGIALVGGGIVQAGFIAAVGRIASVLASVRQSLNA